MSDVLKPPPYDPVFFVCVLLFFTYLVKLHSMISYEDDFIDVCPVEPNDTGALTLKNIFLLQVLLLWRGTFLNTSSLQKHKVAYVL